jgi:glycine/D-amino acid oxidase-like deaminating enzyme
MREIEAHVDGFRHTPDIIAESGVNPDYSSPVVDAYEHLAPIIDTDQYMEWIRNLALSLGARLLTERIHGSIVDNEPALLKRFSATAIINCTGLGAAELAGDNTCYPLRGALVRVINDGTRFPRITSAMAISLDGREGKQDMVFIVPRNDNTLILGGLAEPNEWDLNVNLDNYPPIKAMYDRCLEFYPPLRNGQIDAEYPVAVGLRPFRQTNVRVEREARGVYRGKRSRIVHSYGQGGAGFSLSFGCAADVAKIVDEIVGEVEADTQVMAKM